MKASRFTAAHQSMTFSRRMMLVGGAQAAFGGVLIARLGYLSIAQNEHYQLLSESNRVQLIIVPPRRGWIVDRDGKPIAINRSDFRVDIIPEQLERPTETLRTLTQTARAYRPTTSTASSRRSRRRAATSRSRSPRMSPTTNMPRSPSACPKCRASSRCAASRASTRPGRRSGIWSAMSAPPRPRNMRQEKNPLLVTPGFKIGKEGLEKTLEKQLRGQPGGQRVELTARGKLVRELEPKPDRSGADGPAVDRRRACRNSPRGGWARNRAAARSSTA